MEISTQDLGRIQETIERALYERAEALKPENRESKGYAFSSGYCTSALLSIKAILGNVK
jgi:hypothetical protein